MSTHDFFTVEHVTDSSQATMVAFLKKHENFSLFLLSNFEKHGPHLTEEPNSGNFKLIKRFGKIDGVFCLTRRGNLLVQVDTIATTFDLILATCQQEPIPITGLLGDWDFCQPFWAFLKQKQIITQEDYASRQILYSMELAKCSYPQQSHVRLLTSEDFSQYRPLEMAYIKEEKLPTDLSDEQLLKQFLGRVSEKSSWGLFLNEQLVAVAELNAKAFDLGQVGGVFTHPNFRGRGFAKSVMAQLIVDAKGLHGLRKLIIFCRDENVPARHLYEYFHADHVGHFALFFGK